MSSHHSPATQTYPVRRILSAVFVAYLTNALLVAGSEQLLGRFLYQTRYFVADVLTQSAIQVGCGYLCARISETRAAIAGLIAIGLLVGTISLLASWRDEPRWYAIALLSVYAPCVWLGYRAARRRQLKLLK
jgi:hypothetical protein